MSLKSLAVFSFLFRNNPHYFNALHRNFSRRSANVDGPYKFVKPKKSGKGPKAGNLAWKDPNFELLTSSGGFPFVLPGNVGLAWYDKHTTVQTNHVFVMEQIENSADGNITCRVQECPTVLRQTVCDLFPNRNLEFTDLSVVTISLKPNMKLFRHNKEIETERMAQIFLLAAKNICEKLRKAGFWADFINPFSGRPYLFPSANSTLYETDEKFRCLDFQIFEIKDCKIVSNEGHKAKQKFVGSLFTNAPSKKHYLNSIFTC